MTTRNIQNKLFSPFRRYSPFRRRPSAHPPQRWRQYYQLRTRSQQQVLSLSIQTLSATLED